MAEVKVLVEGVHEVVDKVKVRLKIGSTITLIKSNKNVIVDTGSFLDKEKIIEELKKENLTPEGIEIVILTHLHLDHTVNTSLFQNAKIFCKFCKPNKGYPGQFHIPREGLVERTEIEDGIEIAENITFLLTPGHTPDSISVIVNTNKGKVAITGDAFPSEAFLDLKKEPIPYLVDIKSFNESRNKILKIADYIIPGHGNIFKVKK